MIEYPRIIPSSFASKGDKTLIPKTNDPTSGEASFDYGFPPITQLPIKAGGVAPRRNDFNGIFNAITEHLVYNQAGGALYWSEELNYPINSIVTASNNIQYRCILENGIDTEIGSKNPIEEPEYWENALAPLLYTGAFISLFEDEPPANFYKRDGTIISNASVIVPRLYKSLQLEHNAWKLISEEEYQNRRDNEIWNGVGGVPFFVLNTQANTIRLPDTRGMYEEGIGFDNMLSTGEVHGDMIRNITGTLGGAYYGYAKPFSGAFTQSTSMGHAGTEGAYNTGIVNVNFLASNVVPTGNANKPRAYGVLHCVYVA